MRPTLSYLLKLVILSLGFMQAAHADDANTAYIVTYVEVAPAAKDQALGLLRQLGKASRKDAGNLRFETLQRIGQPGHFAILEAWKDKEAQAAHGTAAHTKRFLEALKPLIRSPFDERPHAGLSVGATQAGGAGAVYAVTHVDIIPTKKDEGIGYVKELSAASRKDKGNMRFDALQQNSRPNHMTLVEVWKDMKAVEAHGMAEHTKQFREQLLPLGGSLYDERLYKVVN